MKRPEPKYEQMEVPRLDPEVKAMNGRSTRRLRARIDELTDLLTASEESDEVPSDDTTERTDAN